MSGPRVFTVEEVNAMIPTLSALVEQQMARHAQIADRMSELISLTGENPPTLVDRPREGPDVIALKAQLRGMVQQYADVWNHVQELGGVVKDPQGGTVDFYANLDGKTVWLCWRYGEQSVAYYHELDAGYAGRRPLRSEVLERTLN
jgi:hypothetical protein